MLVMGYDPLNKKGNHKSSLVVSLFYIEKIEGLMKSRMFAKFQSISPQKMLINCKSAGSHSIVANIGRGLLNQMI